MTRGADAPAELDYSSFEMVSGVELTGLTNGDWTLHVRAKDRYGNIDSTPATTRFTVDLTAPTALIASPRRRDVVGGEVVVIGSAFDGSAVPDLRDYVVEFGPRAGTSEATAWNRVASGITDVENETLGTWETAGLPDGDYLLRLRAMDHLGHASEHTVDVSVDNTPPLVRITQPESGQTHSGVVPLAGEVEDQHLAAYSVSYTRLPAADGDARPDTLWQDITVKQADDVRAAFALDWDSSNETGRIALGITALDRAGNISTPPRVEIQLDNAGALPQTRFTAPEPGAVLAGVVSVTGIAADDNFEQFSLLAGPSLLTSSRRRSST